MKSLKHIIASVALALTPTLLYSQSWREISSPGSDWYWGEGQGATEDEADQFAIKRLLESISTTMKSSTVISADRREEGGKVVKEELTFTSTIESYSAATLRNTGRMVIEREPNARVGRYIRRDEVDKVFRDREKKIISFCDDAATALNSGKIDVALKCYYYAYTLLKSLPKPNDIRFGGKMLMTWIPMQIDDILGDIDVIATAREEDDVDILFTYHGYPVESIDYIFFDGSTPSPLCSAKNGRGVMELTPGHSHNRYKVQIEVQYRDQACIDPEVMQVMQRTPETTFSKTYKVFSGKIGGKDNAATSVNDSTDVSTEPVPQPIASLPQPPIPVQDAALKQPKIPSPFSGIDEEVYAKPTELPEDGTTAYRETIDKILQGVKTKSFAPYRHLMTDDGYARMRKLLKYGNAKLLSSENLTFTPDGDNTVARGLVFSFSFKNGVRRSFTEDVVLTFNAEGLIDNVAFGMGEAFNDCVLGNSAYPEESRNRLTSFMENYQTAYALKDSEFLESIFDEDALIIIGKVLKPKKNGSFENGSILSTVPQVAYTRYNKQEFIKHLKQSFESKEYINLRFNKCRIAKAAHGGEIYGVELEQDYYSSNYYDHGYLFLEINLNDKENPLILIRTWQPEPDPEFGTYNLSDFPIQQFH